MRFKWNYDLARHILKYILEMPYYCDQCKQPCSQKSHSIVQMCTHTAEKPFKCNLCTGAFSPKNVYHFICAHIQKRSHTSAMYARKFFSRKINLTGHFYNHTCEKPFRFNVCTRAFALKHH